jgi:hypothetical protein
LENFYILPNKISLQYHTICAISKYEQAYKDTIKLIKASNINSLDHPFIQSAKFYKEAAKRLRESLNATTNTTIKPTNGEQLGK